MILSLSNQAYIFFITILIGFIMGIFYDFFRLIRKLFEHTNIAVYIEDIIFWVISTFICFYILLHKNNLEFRFYLILGIFLGIIFYFYFISYYFLNFILKLLNFLLKPIKFVMKIFEPHFKKATVAKNKAIYKEKIFLQKVSRYGKIKGRRIKTTLKIIKDKV